MEIARTPEALKALSRRKKRLLAVFPHPDDEAYGCAGALARAGRDPDGAAVLLCLTRGEASKMGPERGLSPDEVCDSLSRRGTRVAWRISQTSCARAAVIS